MTHGEKNLNSFIKEFNNFKSNLKFTFDCHRNSINLLDLNVKLNNDKLIRNVYTSIDRHHYLHYRPSHPDQITRSIIHSQTLRASRLCQFKEDFVDHSEKMKTWFSKRGYPDKNIRNKMKKVNFGESKSKTKSATGVPFVVTYHPRLNAHEYLNLLYMNAEAEDVFTPGPMVSFKTDQKSYSYQVKVTFYPLKRTAGPRECSKNDAKFVKMFKIQILFAVV